MMIFSIVYWHETCPLVWYRVTSSRNSRRDVARIQWLCHDLERRKYERRSIGFLIMRTNHGDVGVRGAIVNLWASFAQTTVRTRYRRHKRTFWQKHRDKLTLAGTTAGGAGIGAIAGGKKGAAIGSLVGLGSGALYTYKIRKRHRHYRRY
jgi:hypothetical protein